MLLLSNPAACQACSCGLCIWTLTCCTNILSVPVKPGSCVWPLTLAVVTRAASIHLNHTRVRVKMCFSLHLPHTDSCTNCPRFPTSPGARTASYSSLCSWTPYHPSIARWRASLLWARYNKHLRPLIMTSLLLL